MRIVSFLSIVLELRFFDEKSLISNSGVTGLPPDMAKGIGKDFLMDKIPSSLMMEFSGLLAVESG
jgi:hypothetical protein